MKKSKKIHGNYGKFKDKRSFGKAGDFDLDLKTTHFHVLKEEKEKRIDQGYYVRTIPDEKTDFWRLYIQKKKKKKKK